MPGHRALVDPAGVRDPPRAHEAGVTLEIASVRRHRVAGQTAFDRQVIEEALDLLRESVSSRHGPVVNPQLSPSTIADSGVNLIAWASATPGLVTSPAITLTPNARAASARTASSRPWVAIWRAYGSVTFVSA